MQASLAAAALGMKGWAGLPQEAPPRRGRIRQSLCWGCFVRGGLTPEVVIQEAVRLGYQSLEMGPAEYWEAIRAAGLTIACTAGHRSLSDGLNRRENHSRIEDELRRSIERAVQYGIPALICFSGNRGGKSDEEGLENCAEGLARVAPFAQEKGVTLVMELLNSKVDHPDYQCDHTRWGVELCQRVNSPAVKLLYDIYHMQIMEGDLIRTIRDNIQYIGHFHTAGNPGRRDLDEEQEIYYPAVMRAIAESGYRGFVSHEFVPKGDPLQAMRHAFQVCDV